MAQHKEYVENGGTDQTEVRYLSEGKYEVRASGGYDGYLTREFTQIEDALDFVASLWNRS